MADLVDSGARTTFDSGAQRETLSDKGRCDLLPFMELAAIFEAAEKPQMASIFKSLYLYIHHGNTDDLYDAFDAGVELMFESNMDTALLELSKHYQDGAKKYADRNWEKGLPLHSFIDSGSRHLLKYDRGDDDEPHDRAFLWNIIGAIYTQENHPECADLPFAMKEVMQKKNKETAGHVDFANRCGISVEMLDKINERIESYKEMGIQVRFMFYKEVQNNNKKMMNVDMRRLCDSSDKFVDSTFSVDGVVNEYGWQHNIDDILTNLYERL